MKMCKNHSDTNGICTCAKCGEWLCETCSVEVNGQIFCKHCIAVSMNGKTSSSVGRPMVHRSERHISGFLFLIFSCILPGLNYMYAGLIKRGLFVLTAFFLIVSALGISHSPILGFLIVILWVTSIFDANEKRRQINSGIHVVDSIDDFTSFLQNYKFLIIGIFAFSIFSDFFAKYMRTFRHGLWLKDQYMHTGFTHLLALAIIGIGIYFILKGIGKKRKNLISNEKKD